MRTLTDIYPSQLVTVTALYTNNAGVHVPYVEDLRTSLVANGILGWTEVETFGYWHGRGESGVRFEFLVPLADDPAEFADFVGRLAREIMVDQEAIQVTREAQTTLVTEA